MSETFNCAVLDCGASKTVCGSEWLKTFLDSFDDDSSKNLEYSASNSVFQFGTGPPVKTLYSVRLPIFIGDMPIFLNTDVINEKIPLLFSKESLKRADSKIDFTNDTINLFNKNIDLIVTKSGHYAIPITKSAISLYTGDISHSHSNLTFLSETSDKKLIAKKLHRQFAHPSLERLLNLLKSSKPPWNEDLELFTKITEISKNCDICKKYKKFHLTPAVSLPMATSFNQCLAMDLKFYNTKILLHLIDYATRFSSSKVIPSKHPKHVIKCIMVQWIAIFGTPGVIFSDNGGEFANQDMLTLAENFNINLCVSAANSPFSNGLVERHNAIIANMLDRILEENDCDFDIALAWAINSKNSLSNIHGFSSYQLAIGFNPILPTNFNNKLPALTSEHTNKLIHDNINYMHKARKAYLELESSERIKRALAAKTRTSSEQIFVTGDKVYYRKMKDKQWHGPAFIMGKLGNTFLIKHGSFHYRVHHAHLTHASEIKQNTNSEPNIIEPEQRQHNNNNSEANQIEDNNDDDEELDEPILNNNSKQNEKIARNTIEENDASENFTTLEDTAHDKHIPLKNVEVHIEPIPQLNLSNQKKNIPTNPLHQLQVNDPITYRKVGEDEWKTGHLTSRAGKSTGKYKDSWNIKLDNGELGYVNLGADDIEIREHDSTEDITEEDITETLEIRKHNSTEDTTEEDITETLYYTSINKTFISEIEVAQEEAKQLELKSWKNQNVYEAVDDENQKCVSVRWVISPKLANGQWKIKARLCARGFEEDFSPRSDSPTSTKEGLRLAFCIISSHNWKIHSIDVKTAFLQGKPIDRNIFIKPPSEAKTNKIWKLLKVVYGLNDASRSWYLCLREELIKLGATPSALDQGIFLYFDKNKKLIGIITVFVDDLIYGGTDFFHNFVIKNLKITFSFGPDNDSIFKYIGIYVEQTNDAIFIDQNNYTECMQYINIPYEKKVNNKQELLLGKKNTEYRSKLGQLNWLSIISRLDVSMSTRYATALATHATIKDAIFVNKIIKQAKSTQYKIKFPSFDLNTLKLVTYTDASYNNLPDGGSQGGYIVFLSDGINSAPIRWHSGRIKRSVRSTLAAETVALADGCDATYNTLNLLKNMINISYKIDCHIYTDNESLFKTCNTTNLTSDLRLRVDLASIRQQIVDKSISLHWINSQDQLADCLTKIGASNKHLIETISNGSNVLLLDE